eukprot:6477307-Amphidinium_carterae.1
MCCPLASSRPGSGLSAARNFREVCSDWCCGQKMRDHMCILCQSLLAFATRQHILPRPQEFKK